MVRRSTPQGVIDEAAFSVRVKVLVPSGGFGRLLDDACLWLDREVGRADHARHPARMFSERAAAFHFRDVGQARRFLEAFRPDAGGREGRARPHVPALPHGGGRRRG